MEIHVVPDRYCTYIPLSSLPLLSNILLIFRFQHPFWLSNCIFLFMSQLCVYTEDRVILYRQPDIPDRYFRYIIPLMILALFYVYRRIYLFSMHKYIYMRLFFLPLRQQAPHVPVSSSWLLSGNLRGRKWIMVLQSFPLMCYRTFWINTCKYVELKGLSLEIQLAFCMRVRIALTKIRLFLIFLYIFFKTFYK